MIELYTSDNGLEISGTVDELQTVKQTIVDLAEGDHCTVALEANSEIDPFPYSSVARKLLFIKKECPTKLSLLNKTTVSIEGSPENLKRLASFLDFEPEAVSKRHARYEYCDGNEWIASDSIPLVISIK